MERMDNWCLITGGSRGIGYELAKLFAKDGYNLVLVARSGDLLSEIKKEFERNDGIEVVPIRLDLINPDSIEKLREEIGKRNIKIDVLVNNAGFGKYGEFVKEDIKRDLDMIRLNIETVTKMTHLFLKDMLDRNRGKILNISSVAAFMPGPLGSVYFSTKSYVLNFSLAIAEEIKGSGVSISILCPGPTKTDFMKTSGMGKAKIMRWTAIPARVTAEVGYRGLKRGKLIIIPGLLNRLMVRGSKILPPKWVMKVVKSVMSP